MIFSHLPFLELLFFYSTLNSSFLGGWVGLLIFKKILLILEGKGGRGVKEAYYM